MVISQNIVIVNFLFILMDNFRDNGFSDFHTWLPFGGRHTIQIWVIDVFIHIGPCKQNKERNSIDVSVNDRHILLF